jgi:hypothetical protein
MCKRGLLHLLWIYLKFTFLISISCVDGYVYGHINCHVHTSLQLYCGLWFQSQFQHSNSLTLEYQALWVAYDKNFTLFLLKLLNVDKKSLLTTNLMTNAKHFLHILAKPCRIHTTSESFHSRLFISWRKHRYILLSRFVQLIYF